MIDKAKESEDSGVVSNLKNMPWKSIVWSMILGGIITITLGFGILGDWHMGSTVAKLMNKQEKQFAQSYGVPLCVSQFLDSGQPAADIETIEGYSQWKRGTELADAASSDKFAWVIMPGEEKANLQIATGCSKEILKLKGEVAEKTG